MARYVSRFSHGVESTPNHECDGFCPYPGKGIIAFTVSDDGVEAEGEFHQVTTSNVIEVTLGLVDKKAIEDAEEKGRDPLIEVMRSRRAIIRTIQEAPIPGGAAEDSLQEFLNRIANGS